VSILVNLALFGVLIASSPIHDHAGSHCVMKILDGELQETLFDWPTSSADEQEEVIADITEAASPTHNELNGQPLAVSRDTVYQPNQVTYVHGNDY
jgi:cysteine dioxygenase